VHCLLTQSELHVSKERQHNSSRLEKEHETNINICSAARRMFSFLWCTHAFAWPEKPRNHSQGLMDGRTMNENCEGDVKNRFPGGIESN
jgi:hypothetical protein